MTKTSLTQLQKLIHKAEAEQTAQNYEQELIETAKKICPSGGFHKSEDFYKNNFFSGLLIGHKCSKCNIILQPLTNYGD